MRKFGLVLFLLLSATGCVNSRYKAGMPLNQSTQSALTLGSSGSYGNSDYNCPSSANIGGNYSVCTSKSSKSPILVYDESYNPRGDGICVMAAQYVSSSQINLVEDNAGNAVSQCGVAGDYGLPVNLSNFGYDVSVLNAVYIVREADMSRFQDCLHGQTCPTYFVGRFR